MEKSLEHKGVLQIMQVSSTSPSGGNLVDGLPPASSFDHANVVLNYVCLETIIVLDNVLQLWIVVK